MATLGNSHWANINAYVPKPPSGNFVEGESWLPEDAEVEDIAQVKKFIDEAFDKMYPRFTPEIIHAFDKDYFLPALKVLRFDGTNYISPSKEATWQNMELFARCKRFLYGDTPQSHDAPDDCCDCGIYGSVNLEEIWSYIQGEESRYSRGHFIMNALEVMEVNGRRELRVKDRQNMFRPSHETYSLCIIEPLPDAKVILCRKGWKASHAFISEIIDETMDFDQASSLLSTAWHRPLDLHNLRRMNESW